MPNAREIVEWWLAAHGYDGLAGGDCGCLLSDLMPCDSFGCDCVPGRKVSCDPETCEYGGGCEWHVVPAEEDTDDG